MFHLFGKLSGSFMEMLQGFCAVMYVETIVFNLPFELFVSK